MNQRDKLKLWWRQNHTRIGKAVVSGISILSDFTGLLVVVTVVWLLVLLAKVQGIAGAELVLKQIGWPQTLVLFGLIFLVPIYRMLRNLAARLSTVTKIKIGDIEIQEETLIDIIIEREKLRTGVYLASVDGDSKGIELQYLRSVEREMPDRLADLTEMGRLSVLQTAIQMSISDRELHPKEYDALKNLASKFIISQDDLDNKITSAVIEKRIEGVDIKLPPELKTRFEQAKKGLGIL